MHVHIAMMGQATEPITKSFQALGYDKLYVLTGEKYKDSFESVKETLRNFNVEVDSMPVTGFNFQEIVDSINRIYESEKGDGTTFSINITGGTNLMAAAACSCAFFIGATIYYVMNDDRPVKEQVVSIPTPKTPDLGSLKEETREILRFILKRTEEGNSTITSDLTDHFDRSKQSINYQIKLLKSESLVQNGPPLIINGRTDNRSRTIELTPHGRLIASWI